MTPPEITPPEDLWDGWDELTEPDDPSAVTHQERADVSVDEFWKSRPVLAHLHDFARARRAGPWAVLGATLTRVVAATPPMVQLPPTIGSYASLNLFVGLVGSSSDGKDIGWKVARDAIEIQDETFKVLPLGSGEGLSHMFMRSEKGEPDPVQWNQAALVRIGEIDTLGALVQRQSSTVTSQLRQAAMGEQLGFFYVDQAKRMLVPEHLYRLTLLAGVQPKRSAVLLDDADGGTPQRFVWLPAGDPAAPDYPPAEPTPYIWTAPAWIHALRGTSVGRPCMVMALPKVATDTIIRARVARLRGEGEALDGHALLTRAKVAAALAILEQRMQVDEQDWDLAGTIMAVSDTQRARCQRELSAIKIEKNMGQAVAEAERTLIIEEKVSTAKLTKVASTIKRRLGVVGKAGETAGKLRAALASGDRQHFSSVIDSLLIAGEIRAEGIEHNTATSQRYYLN